MNAIVLIITNPILLKLYQLEMHNLTASRSSLKDFLQTNLGNVRSIEFHDVTLIESESTDINLLELHFPCAIFKFRMGN